jgi:hypothetical protein
LQPTTYMPWPVSPHFRRAKIFNPISKNPVMAYHFSSWQFLETSTWCTFALFATYALLSLKLCFTLAYYVFWKRITFLISWIWKVHFISKIVLVRQLPPSPELFWPPWDSGTYMRERGGPHTVRKWIHNAFEKKVIISFWNNLLSEAYKGCNCPPPELIFLTEIFKHTREA